MTPERPLRPAEHTPDAVLPEKLAKSDSDAALPPEPDDKMSTAERADDVKVVPTDDADDDEVSGPRTTPLTEARIHPGAS